MSNDIRADSLTAMNASVRKYLESVYVFRGLAMKRWPEMYDVNNGDYLPPDEVALVRRALLVLNRILPIDGLWGVELSEIEHDVYQSTLATVVIDETIRQKIFDIDNKLSVDELLNFVSNDSMQQLLTRISHVLIDEPHIYYPGHRNDNTDSDDEEEARGTDMTIREALEQINTNKAEYKQAQNAWKKWRKIKSISTVTQKQQQENQKGLAQLSVDYEIVTARLEHCQRLSEKALELVSSLFIHANVEIDMDNDVGLSSSVAAATSPEPEIASPAAASPAAASPAAASSAAATPAAASPAAATPAAATPAAATPAAAPAAPAAAPAAALRAVIDDVNKGFVYNEMTDFVNTAEFLDLVKDIDVSKTVFHSYNTKIDRLNDLTKKLRTEYTRLYNTKKLPGKMFTCNPCLVYDGRKDGKACRIAVKTTKFCEKICETRTYVPFVRTRYDLTNIYTTEGVTRPEDLMVDLFPIIKFDATNIMHRLAARIISTAVPQPENIKFDSMKMNEIYHNDSSIRGTLQSMYYWNLPQLVYGMVTQETLNKIFSEGLYRYYEHATLWYNFAANEKYILALLVTLVPGLLLPDAIVVHGSGNETNMRGGASAMQVMAAMRLRNYYKSRHYDSTVKKLNDIVHNEIDRNGLFQYDANLNPLLKKLASQLPRDKTVPAPHAVVPVLKTTMNRKRVNMDVSPGTRRKRKRDETPEDGEIVSVTTTPSHTARVVDEPPAIARVVDEPPAIARVVDEPPVIAQVVDEPPAIARVVDQPPAIARVVDEPPVIASQSDDTNTTPSPPSYTNPKIWKLAYAEAKNEFITEGRDLDDRIAIYKRANDIYERVSQKYNEYYSSRFKKLPRPREPQPREPQPPTVGRGRRLPRGGCTRRRRW